MMADKARYRPAHRVMDAAVPTFVRLRALPDEKGFPPEHLLPHVSVAEMALKRAPASTRPRHEPPRLPACPGLVPPSPTDR